LQVYAENIQISLAFKGAIGDRRQGKQAGGKASRPEARQAGRYCKASFENCTSERKSVSDFTCGKPVWQTQNKKRPGYLIIASFCFGFYDVGA